MQNTRMYANIQSLREKTKDLLNLDFQQIRETIIDDLIYTAVFAKDEELKKESRALIRQIADKFGISSASIKPLYDAIGRGEISGFTVPAMNIRALTYDTAQSVFQLVQKHRIAAFIFEIARSEIGYTNQRPDEYAVVVLAGAIKSGYQGPVFLQGDHYQLSKSKFQSNKEEEMQGIKNLIKESLEAGFRNIDIDASTLVDLEKPSLDEQQKTNYEVTAALTTYIRENQPEGFMVSIGGEIGHIGGKNSTVLEFEAFMHGYTKLVPQNGMSKVSVQTGTSHGGIPRPDGSIADVKLDFSVLRDIGRVAKEKYRLAGAVQHGASTLPAELFDTFPNNNTVEIHLATGFQNIVYENLPSALREDMHEWTKQNCASEKEEGWTDEQFVYKTRKKALGPFKEQLWNLRKEEKQPILEKLEAEFELIFSKLDVFNTRDVVSTYIKDEE